MAGNETIMSLLLSDSDGNVVGRSVIEHYHFYRTDFGGRQRMVLYVMCKVGYCPPAWLSRGDNFRELAIEMDYVDGRHAKIVSHYVGEWRVSEVYIGRHGMTGCVDENPVVVFESFAEPDLFDPLP